MRRIVVGLALAATLLVAAAPASASASAGPPNLNGSFRFAGTLIKSNANGHPRQHFHETWSFRKNAPGSADGCNSTFAVRLVVAPGSAICMRRHDNVYTGHHTVPYYVCPATHKDMKTLVSYVIHRTPPGEVVKLHGIQTAYAGKQAGCRATFAKYQLDARRLSSQ
jgi:hypothetical protein